MGIELWRRWPLSPMRCVAPALVVAVHLFFTFLSIQNNMEQEPKFRFNCSTSVNKPTSMTTLIMWNISKALKTNPGIDLRSAIKAAQSRLEQNTRDIDLMIFEYPEERHLACAVLAWQQLGHHEVDSLYNFIETKLLQMNTSSRDDGSNSLPLPDTSCAIDAASVKVNFCTMGPVVKLPTQTSIVMRMESIPNRQKNLKTQDTNIRNKIDAACCLDSECLERLTSVDKMTTELRNRASRLAKRESQRVELLERAEAAWKDLELGYQRRLGLAEEKEEDMRKQIERLIEERNGNKNACTILAKQLKERGDVAEKERARLTKIEKEGYDRACVRLRLSEEAARGDAALAEQQCRTAQVERDLQYKEEQARRKIMSLESEIESARTLTHEAERAMRFELGALREQIAVVSKQLLEEDNNNSLIKQALEQLRQEKMELVEDLEGCKASCDNRMQGRLDELKKRREQLNALKDKITECRCKLPIDISVEVKRTPSFAALCCCSPDDKLVESCSCTSLRGRLLSNLLSDLFGGLQAELGGSGNQMPCQLLKCLEDKHNWDRASIVKTNLRNFFSKLLIGELDIAIATSIEKYHAKWVGESCADEARLVLDPSYIENEEWQEKVLERKAQKLASQLAEQLFKERADQIEKRVKDIVMSGPQPCECAPQTAFPCMVDQKMYNKYGKSAAKPQWPHMLQDVTQLRIQIEDLKKDSIKKEDLKLMEKNITKLVQRASGLDKVDCSTYSKTAENCFDNHVKKVPKPLKMNMDLPKKITPTKSVVTPKNPTITECFNRTKPKNLFQVQGNKLFKANKRFGKEYAVNMCLYSNSKEQKQQSIDTEHAFINEKYKNSHKPDRSNDLLSQMSSIKVTKPINLPSSELPIQKKMKFPTAQASCLSNCKCFHKIPSNKSINKLFELLTKRKCLENSPDNGKETVNHSIINSCGNNNTILNKSISITNNLSKTDTPLDVCKVPVIESKLSYSENNQIYACNYKDNDIKGPPPPVTESEYMGAINLDKSNENFCKCIRDITKSKIDQLNMNTEQNQSVPLKCINSTICECNPSQDIKESQIKSKENLFSQSLPVQKTNPVFIQRSTEGKQSNENNLVENEPKIVLKETLVSNSTIKENLFPHNCDYYVKFLGITLAEINSTKNTVESSLDVEKLNQFENKLSTDIVSRCSKKEINKSNKYEILNSFPSNKVPKCDCKANFEELKKLISEMLTKEVDRSILNNNKPLNTVCIQVSDSVDDNCICCNHVDLEESNNLEENAFHLLEEHIKEKLDKFKISYCKSSCILPKEEEKLFSTIVCRVKEIISDSTKQITCKCSEEESTEGSWKRAYGLLQEYLKIKLKRVQCSCGSLSVNHDDTTTLFKEVLEKVCLLIEKDFDRLKQICNCKNFKHRTEITNKILCKDVHEEDLPEKDINSNSNELTRECKIKSYIFDGNTDDINQLREKSNKSIILSQNISLQGQQTQVVENKSCHVFEKCNKGILTQESEDIVFYNNLRKSQSDILKQQNDLKFLDSSGDNELYFNYCTEITTTQIPNSLLVSNLREKNSGTKEQATILQDSNRKNSNINKFMLSKFDSVQKNKIPYIGKTVDCSCEGKIGSCVCIKSMLQKNDNKFVSIWEMFTKASTCAPNVSYIMNSIIDKTAQKKKDIINLTEDIYGASFSEIHSLRRNLKKIYDIKINASAQDELIVSKSAKETMPQNHCVTNIYSENCSSDCLNGNDKIIKYDYIRINNSGINLDNEFRMNLDNEFEINNDQGKFSENYNKSLDIVNKKDIALHCESTKCDCNTVPVCHVKMLVESIENKLVNAQCTCDSLTPKVCPVHSPNISVNLSSYSV